MNVSFKNVLYSIYVEINYLSYEGVTKILGVSVPILSEYFLVCRIQYKLKECIKKKKELDNTAINFKVFNLEFHLHAPCL